MKAYAVTTFLVLSLLFGNSLVYSQAKQIDNSAYKANPTSTQSYIGFGNVFPNEYEYPIEGSPYFNDKYVKGTIYHHRTVYKNMEMRYNICHDRIEFKAKDTVLMVGPDKLVKKVELGDQTLVVQLLETKGKPTLTYFIRQDSGKLTILTKMTITIKAPQFGKPIEGNVPAKYMKMPDTQYYMLDAGKPVKIQNLKKLIDELPDHQQEMETFAKKEKISASKPKDLVLFSRYYNSLQ